MWLPSTPAMAASLTDRVWTPLVYKDVAMCYNNYRVA
jgi:hypothetical protein